MDALRRAWVYWLAAVTSVLAVVALSLNAYAIYVCYIKNNPPDAFGYFMAALLLFFVAFAIVAGALLVTNTRRPRGIDPDVPIGPVMGFDKATLDAFSLTTDEVLKHEKKRVRPDDIPLGEERPTTVRVRRQSDTDDSGVAQRRVKRDPHVVIDERGEPYGRRATDIPIADIKRTIEAVRQIRGAGGDPKQIIDVPEWVEAVDQAHLALHPEAAREFNLDLDLEPPADAESGTPTDEAAIEPLDAGLSPLRLDAAEEGA